MVATADIVEESERTALEPGWNRRAIFRPNGRRRRSERRKIRYFAATCGGGGGIGGESTRMALQPLKAPALARNLVVP